MKKQTRIYISICLYVFFFTSAFARQTFSVSDSLYRKRLNTVIISESVGYSVTMTGLYGLWYKNYNTGRFHFFNDNAEWLLMDKIGHSTTAYYVGKVGYDVLKWSGLNEKKSVWYGGLLGWTFLSTVEVFDGFSSGWGFSWGDMAFNTAGSGLFIGQQLAWKEQRIKLKFSFHQSQYSKYNPELLGSSLSQQILKDYNGQTYWMSMNISSFLEEGNKIPKWLNLALGYSGEGMLGGRSNPVSDKRGNPLPYFERNRRYFLSADIDLSRIKTRYKWVNTILGAVGFIKIPFPALEFNNHGTIKGHWVYF